MCKDLFTSEEDLDSHINEHKEEINEIYRESLTNDHDIFECELICFESGYEGSMKKHLMDHVNSSLAVEKSVKIVKTSKKEKRGNVKEEYF